MRFKFLKSLAAATAMFTAVLSILISVPAFAAFNKNSVISDTVFNSQSMKASDIDSWINNKFGSTSCISTAHKFTAPEPIAFNPGSGFTSAGSFNYTTAGFWYGPDKSAGTIIYDAAHVYGLNPKVILSTLEKEEGLVSGGSGCSTNRYTSAVGYDCTDSGSATHNYTGYELYSINGAKVKSVTGSCVARQQEAGFSQQIIFASWQLKFNQQRSLGNVDWNIQASNFPHSGDKWDNSSDPSFCYTGYMTPGDRALSGSSTCTENGQSILPNQKISFDGKYTIDSTRVVMETGATASLYDYTPHISGNQSFYNIYTNWFGTTIYDTNKDGLASGAWDRGTYRGYDSPAVRRGSSYYFDFNIDGFSDKSFSIGRSSDNVIVGDWEQPSGDSDKEIGLQRGNQFFLLDSNGGNSHDFKLGKSTDNFIVGDWNGDGSDTLAFKRGACYYFDDYNDGTPNYKYCIGRSSDRVVVGDWAGDGKDNVGLVRGAHFYLLGYNYTTHKVRVSSAFGMGRATDSVLVGKWSNDGKDYIGLRRQYQNNYNTFFFDTNDNGNADISFHMGRWSDKLTIGDWNNNGMDTIALKRSNEYFLLRSDGTVSNDFVYYY